MNPFLVILPIFAVNIIIIGTNTNTTDANAQFTTNIAISDPINIIADVKTSNTNCAKTLLIKSTSFVSLDTISPDWFLS